VKKSSKDVKVQQYIYLMYKLGIITEEQKNQFFQNQ